MGKIILIGVLLIKLIVNRWVKINLTVSDHITKQVSVNDNTKHVFLNQNKQVSEYINNNKVKIILAKNHLDLINLNLEKKCFHFAGGIK